MTAPVPQSETSQPLQGKRALLNYASRFADDGEKFPNNSAISFFDAADIDILPPDINFNVPWPEELETLIVIAKNKNLDYAALMDELNLGTSDKKNALYENLITSSLQAWWGEQVYKLIEFLYTPEHDGLGLIDKIVLKIKELENKPSFVINLNDDDKLKREIIDAYIKIFQHHLLLQLPHSDSISPEAKKPEMVLPMESVIKTQVLNTLVKKTSSAETKSIALQRAVNIFDLVATIEGKTENKEPGPAFKAYNKYISTPNKSYIDACIVRCSLTHIVKNSNGWNINYFLEKLASIFTFGLYKPAYTPVTQIQQAFSPIPPATSSLVLG